MIRTLYYAVVFWFVGFLLEYSFLRFMPDSYFLEMYSVEPSQGVFGTWENARFITHADYKYPWEVTRSDIQYCRNNDSEDYIYYSYYISNSYNAKSEKVVGKEWVYNMHRPTSYKQCYLYNISTLDLHYGIKKYDVYISKPYIYQ